MDAEFVHDEDCPCFGDDPPHAKECANCECEERVAIKVVDRKTEALKTIHDMCNKALSADDLSTRMLKDIRAIASEAWPD